jgi:hypothetical protein
MSYNNSTMKPRLLTLTAVVLFAALWRLIPHPWNLTPVTAMALFAGAHFSSRRTAYLLPVAAILLSNLLLGSFYATLPFVLISFVIAVSLGTLLRQRRDVLSIGSATLASSVIFFVLTNAAHWLLAPDYPKTTAGFFACFSAAVPFFRNTLLGDLFFTAVFFGGFALLERRFSSLRDPAVSAPLTFRPR